MTLLVISPDYASHLLPLATLATAWRDAGEPVVVATGPATAGIVAGFGFDRADLVLGRGSNPGVIRAFRTGTLETPVALPEPVAAGPGVALLPLRALTADDDGTGAALDYELQALFCGAQALRVVSRLSVLPLLPLALSPEDWCRRLQVDYLVSGAWRLEGGHVQVFLEVTQGSTGSLVGGARGRVAAAALCQGDDDGLRQLGEQVLRSVFDSELRRCGSAALPTVASYALLHRGIGLMHRMSRPAAEDEPASSRARKRPPRRVSATDRERFEPASSRARKRPPRRVSATDRERFRPASSHARKRPPRRGSATDRERFEPASSRAR